jgi:hypothetical protein
MEEHNATLVGVLPSTRLLPPTSNPPHVVVIGAGPAGLFAALSLVRARTADGGAACRVTLLERGQSVEERGKDIGALIVRRKLNPESNLCFGEGGAGTWSDGKLTTKIGKNQPLVRAVLNTLVEFGAPESILMAGKPHIGTDKLVEILKQMRASLIKAGCEVRFGDRVDEILVEETESHIEGDAAGGAAQGAVADGGRDVEEGSSMSKDEEDSDSDEEHMVSAAMASLLGKAEVGEEGEEVSKAGELCDEERERDEGEESKAEVEDESEAASDTEDEEGSRDDEVVWSAGAATAPRSARRRAVRGVRLSSGEVLHSDSVILAPGHSARDMYAHLRDLGVQMEAKRFAMGFRMEHSQETIDVMQYGQAAAARVLRGSGPVPTADYKISANVNGSQSKVLTPSVCVLLHMYACMWRPLGPRVPLFLLRCTRAGMSLLESWYCMYHAVAQASHFMFNPQKSTYVVEP